MTKQAIRFAVVAMLVLMGMGRLSMNALGQGSLVPTGAPAPMMKTLDQIEPRTPISALPYTITQPGSYFVTSDLMEYAAGGLYIGVAARDVTLDLCGFRVPCIRGVGGVITNLVVRNGSVGNATDGGILISSVGGRFVDLRIVDENMESYGMHIWGSANLIENCSFEGYRDLALDLDSPRSIVRQCIFQPTSGGMGIGIAIYTYGSIIEDCLFSSGGVGIELDTAATGTIIRRCAFYGNISRAIAFATVFGSSSAPGQGSPIGLRVENNHGYGNGSGLPLDNSVTNSFFFGNTLSGISD